MPASENEKLVQSQSTHEEASSGHQQFCDQGSSNSMKSPATYRISDLPDGLLQDILSFLPAPEVVRTSILSPQWRDVWKFVPCLHAQTVDQFDEDGDKFVNFVSNLLESRADKAPLKVFSFHSPRSEEANSWIRYAINHNVELLEFSEEIYDEPPFLLDTGIVNFSSSHLKILVLTNVTLSAIHFSQLKDHCPKLQVLKLDEDSHLETFEISSRSLTSLCIKDCTCPGDMLICAPELTSLSFINSGNEVVSLEKLPSIVEASVVLYFNIDSPYETNWEIVENYQYSILQSLSHAKSIELNIPIIREIRALENELQRGQLFSNLTSLILGEWCMADLYPVAWFLQQAPLLENLHVLFRHIRPWYRMEYEPTVFAQERLFRAPCLNNVTIRCVKPDPMLQELIKMLRSAAKSSLVIKIQSDYFEEPKLAD